LWDSFNNRDRAERIEENGIRHVGATHFPPAFGISMTFGFGFSPKAAFNTAVKRA
jgi:hypothetical protein